MINTKEILKIYKHWLKTHKQTWETNNLVGELVGWDAEYIKFVKDNKLSEEN